MVLMKEEATTMDEDAEANDVMAVNLSTSMVPTINELYLNGQMALDALSIIFAHTDFESLSESSDGDIDELPIGFELQRDRASPHVSKLEYHERNAATMELAKKWKIALMQWTTTRGRYQCQFESTPKQPTLSNRKRKVDLSVDTSCPKTSTHKICCVDGCDGDVSELKRVPEYPKKPERDASRLKQITYAIKRFKQQECTERLGFGRKCNYKNLRACKKHWKPVDGKSASRKMKQADGSMKKEKFPIPTFLCPERVGNNSFHSPSETTSKGNSTDRAMFRYVAEISSNEHALANQQILEMQDVKTGDQDIENINPRILSAAGLDVHLG